MTNALTIFIITLVCLLALFWVSKKRKDGRVFSWYERLLKKSDPQVKRVTFRFVRKTVVLRDSFVRAIQKWSIAFVHFFLEITHFISARLNKGLVRMKYKTRKKVQEINTQEPSEFLRQVKEERE